jgi:hypothetical protein
LPWYIPSYGPTTRLREDQPGWPGWKSRAKRTGIGCWEARHEESVTFEDLRDIGQKERDALLNADVVVILLPGGKGTHVEMGIAIGQAKRIILHSPDDAINNFETTSTFYHLPEVETCHGTFDELLEKITGRELAETDR